MTSPIAKGSHCPRCGSVIAQSAGSDTTAPCPVCALDGAVQNDGLAPDEGDGSDWTEILDPAHAPAVGEIVTRRFGPYELLEEIGRGGMGVVYRTRQVSPARIVALKVILPLQSSAPGMVDRFKAEVETIASLDHANILPVYEAGERDGLPYFTMKFADGGSLATGLSSFASKPREAAALLTLIARAVGHAHRRGILHRDLKPGNILLDAHGHPYVADFGMAKWMGRDQAATLAGVAVGTPSYMSPEQASGRSADLTVSSDIYSLGGILYELLVQRPPFAAESVVEILRQVANDQPVSLRSVRADIPRDLETICLKCLAKEPGRRYASADALAEDLQRWLDGRPVHARPVGALERVWRWSSRNPVPAALAAISLALLLAVAVGSSIAARRLSVARAEATEQLRAALIAQAKASRLTGRLGQRFETLAALKKAAAIHPGLDLRDEALAAFALPDARLAQNWKLRHASNSPVAFDSTGKRFVVESDAGVLTLHEAKDGREVRRYAAPPGSPRAIYIAPLDRDDTKFVVRFADHRVRVYDLGHDAPLWELTSRPVCQMNASFAYDFAFTPDGKEVAIGLPEGGLSFHDASTGRETSRIECGFTPAVIAFSPDGAKVALAALRKTDVMIFDRASGRTERTLAHPKSIVHCAWRPDGEQLAVACFDNRIYLWDNANGALSSALRGHTETPTQLAWRSDSRLLASTGRDQTVRLWDPTDGAPMLIVARLLGEPCLRFSRDGTSLAYAGDETSIGRLELRVDDFRRDWFHGTPGDHSSVHGGLDVSSDGRLIVVSTNSGVRLLDARDGTWLVELPGLSPGGHTAQFTPVADALIYSDKKTGTFRRALRWTTPDALEIGPAVRVDSRPGFYVSEVRGDPVRLSLLSEDPNVASIISLTGATPPANLPMVGEPQNCTLHPREKIAVTSDREGDEAGASDVRVWNTADGKLIKRLELGRDGSARFSPDGTLLWASGGENSVVLHWPDLTPAVKTPLAGFDGWFSPDGAQLAVGDNDQIVLLKLPEGTTLGHLPGSTMLNLRYSADGARLFACMNFQVYAWDLRAVRRELAVLGLDWDGPPQIEAKLGSGQSIGIVVRE